MDRAEQAGVGVAVIGHIALFAALSLSLLAVPELPKLHNDPVEVELVDEVALQSAAPQPAAPAPAPAPAVQPEQAMPEPAPPPPLPKAEPAPTPKPVAKALPPPKAVPKAPPKPIAKPAPPQTAALDTRPRRRPGLSRSIVTGLETSAAHSRAPAAKPAAAPAGQAAQIASPQQAASLAAEIRRQIKPHWKAPSGADVEQLRVRIVVRLARDGSLLGAPEVKSPGVTGITESNKSQAALFAENAVRAVRAAAPFRLPTEFYESWKLIDSVNFDKRLSQ